VPKIREEKAPRTDKKKKEVENAKVHLKAGSDWENILKDVPAAKPQHQVNNGMERRKKTKKLARKKGQEKGGQRGKRLTPWLKTGNVKKKAKNAALRGGGGGRQNDWVRKKES